MTAAMTSGKFHVQSCGLFWFMSTVYLVQTALPTTVPSPESPIQAVFSLSVRRPRVAGGALTIPIDSTVRLVKCSRKEAAHSSIRLRYGNAPRKCLVMRASNSLERDKWLVAIIQAMAAAQNFMEHTPASTALSETASTQRLSTSVHEWEKAQSLSCVAQVQTLPDSDNSLVIHLDKDCIPVIQHPLSSTATDISPIDMIHHPSIIGYLHEEQEREKPSPFVTKFFVTFGRARSSN